MCRLGGYCIRLLGDMGGVIFQNVYSEFQEVVGKAVERISKAHLPHHIEEGHPMHSLLKPTAAYARTHVCFPIRVPCKYPERTAPTKSACQMVKPDKRHQINADLPAPTDKRRPNIATRLAPRTSANRQAAPRRKGRAEDGRAPPGPVGRGGGRAAA